MSTLYLDCKCHDYWTDPETGEEYVYDSFMDALALHNLHTLIFLTALFHILYSAVIMLLSQCSVKKWAHWETYGDEEDETLDKLITPAKVIQMIILRTVFFFFFFFL